MHAGTATVLGGRAQDRYLSAGLCPIYISFSKSTYYLYDSILFCISQCDSSSVEVPCVRQVVILALADEDQSIKDYL